MIQKKNDEESNNNFKIRWDCKERAQHNNEDYPYSEETNLLQQKAVEIHETGGVGDFVKFYNETESKGFVFEVPFEIRKVRKEEMHSAYNIYKGVFMAWDENMKKWVQDNASIGLYKWGKLLAVLTYKKFKFQGITCTQVLLLAVQKELRVKGYGSQLLKHFMEFREDIVILSDFDAVDFYKKHGFREEPNLPERLKRCIQAENDTLCMAKGFNFKEEPSNIGDLIRKYKSIVTKKEGK